MRKWLLPTLLVIFCAYAAVQMFYSLDDREKPAEPSPGASSSESAAPAPTGSATSEPGGTAATGTVDEAAATAIYKSNCLSCHGDQLQGNIGPALANVGSSMTADQIAKQIENGGGVMPAFKGKLSDDEIQTVTAWLAAKK